MNPLGVFLEDTPCGIQKKENAVPIAKPLAKHIQTAKVKTDRFGETVTRKI